VRAYVLVGLSRRLPGKHTMKVISGKRLIDLVVDNLQNMGLDVVVYSKIPLDLDVPVLHDESSWILESVVSLLKMDDSFLLFGGDMPLVRMEAVKLLLKNYGHTSVVPRWSNGYLEPLHAYYARSAIKCLEGARSLTLGLQNCPYVNFVPAEKMPEETFFNVNTRNDMELLKRILAAKDK